MTNICDTKCPPCPPLNIYLFLCIEYKDYCKNVFLSKYPYVHTYTPFLLD